jgi:hypothetical protein
MRDIMIRTRSRGVTVEKYFATFGQKVQGGMTELVFESF